MTQEPPTAAVLPSGSRAWAAVRALWALALLGLIVVGGAQHSDTTFGYLGALSGMAALERRLAQEGRSPFFNRAAKAIDLALAALLGAAIALIVWTAGTR